MVDHRTGHVFELVPIGTDPPAQIHIFRIHKQMRIKPAQLLIYITAHRECRAAAPGRLVCDRIVHLGMLIRKLTQFPESKAVALLRYIGADFRSQFLQGIRLQFRIDIQKCGNLGTALFKAQVIGLTEAEIAARRDQFAADLILLQRRLLFLQDLHRIIGRCIIYYINVDLILCVGLFAYGCKAVPDPLRRIVSHEDQIHIEVFFDCHLEFLLIRIIAVFSAVLRSQLSAHGYLFPDGGYILSLH